MYISTYKYIPLMNQTNLYGDYQIISLYTDTYQNSPLHTRIHHCILIHTKGQKTCQNTLTNHDIVARIGKCEQFIRTKRIYIAS